MVAKFADHLPLYRQEKIFGCIELAIACSTIAQWVGQTDVRLRPLVDALSEPVLKQGVIHADETPVQMLAPGEKKTHRAYVWSYGTTSISTLDFSPSRAGEHARNFLNDWNPLHIRSDQRTLTDLGSAVGERCAGSRHHCGSRSAYRRLCSVNIEMGQYRPAICPSRRAGRDPAAGGQWQQSARSGHTRLDFAAVT